MFQKLKETMFKELNPSVVMTYQMENINKEISYRKESDWNSGVEKYNKWNEKFTGDPQQLIFYSNRIGRHEEILVEVIQTEEQKENCMIKNE